MLSLIFNKPKGNQDSKDPNFHSNINLHVPGVDQPIPAPPVVTAYTGTNNAHPTLTMFGTPYTAATQPPLTPHRQPSHPISTPILSSENQHPALQQNPAPYYVQYPGRQYTTHQ